MICKSSNDYDSSNKTIRPRQLKQIEVMLIDLSVVWAEREGTLFWWIFATLSKGSFEWQLLYGYNALLLGCFRSIFENSWNTTWWSKQLWSEWHPFRRPQLTYMWIMVVICCLYLNWLDVSTRILRSICRQPYARISRQKFRLNKFVSFTRATLDSGLNSLTLLCFCLFIQNYRYHFWARDLRSEKFFSK